MAQSGRARSALGPALIAVGGVLMVFGSTIVWVRYAFARAPLELLSQSRLGIASGAGRVTIACGAIALATVPVMLAGSPPWRRGMAVAALALGIGAAAIAVTSLATKDARVYGSIRTAIADTTGHVVTDAEFTRLKGQLLATGFAISLGPGIYVVLAGGLLAAAGGLADLADGQRTSSDVPPTDPSDVSSVVPPPHLGQTTSPEPTPPGTSI